MSKSPKARRPGRPASAETSSDRITASWLPSYEERQAHAARAKELAQEVVESYNDHLDDPKWGVLVMLVQMYLVIADGLDRGIGPFGEPPRWPGKIAAYWPQRSTITRMGEQVLINAMIIGHLAQRDAYQDQHERFRSRSDTPTRAPADGWFRGKRRRLVAGLDAHGRVEYAGHRDKLELQASDFLLRQALGAWVGFLAIQPPADWNVVRHLRMKWDSGVGHPVCVHEYLDQNGALAHFTPYGALDPLELLAGATAIHEVNQERQRTGKSLEEPSFNCDEAIKVFGALVGFCPDAERATQRFLAFCNQRNQAGRLWPPFALRHCVNADCPRPLFLWHAPHSASGGSPHQGRPRPSNYCPRCEPHKESLKRRHTRQRSQENFGEAGQ